MIEQRNDLAPFVNAAIAAAIVIAAQQVWRRMAGKPTMIRLAAAVGAAAGTAAVGIGIKFLFHV